jgi:hypothetical protein
MTMDLIGPMMMDLIGSMMALNRIAVMVVVIVAALVIVKSAVKIGVTTSTTNKLCVGALKNGLKSCLFFII